MVIARLKDSSSRDGVDEHGLQQRKFGTDLIEEFAGIENIHYLHRQ
jgi:hypothetical protein